MAFSEEDKEWLKQVIEASEVRTGQCFHALIDPRFKEIDDRFLGLEERMSQKIEKFETNLLTAFHKWASTAEARDRARAETIYSLDVQVAALAERVRALEERQRN